MSKPGALHDLMEYARGIDAGEEYFRQGSFTPQAIVNNRSAYRATIAAYLATLEKHLSKIGMPCEALAPLRSIVDQIHALEMRDQIPPFFDLSGVAFNLSKSPQRLSAEGHAVGCVCYLNEVLNDQLTFACKTVASIFSHLGHRGRISHRAHTPKAKAGLSWKTLHQWHCELALPGDSRDLASAIRRTAKQSALDSLIDAERANPLAGLPTEEWRTGIAERILDIAVQTRIGMPGEPRITIAQTV